MRPRCCVVVCSPGLRSDTRCAERQSVTGAGTVVAGSVHCGLGSWMALPRPGLFRLPGFSILGDMQSRDGALSTLSSEAYEGLRRAIVEGELRPNQRLVETELVERFAIGRTPIREALQRLAVDGLLSRERGWVVREHRSDEIRQIYEVRAALEGFAARLAAERATDEELAKVFEIHRNDGRDPAVISRDELVRVNDAFHAAIADAARNPQLEGQIRHRMDLFFNRRTAALFSDEEARASVTGHDQIMAALRARDGVRADAAVRQHVLEALEVTLAKNR